MRDVWKHMKSAGAHGIFCLVSGYPTGMREQKPLAFLTAVVDDSGAETGDGRLFLAGYLQSSEDWARFSDAWNTELAAGRPIQYLKMSEANSFRKEFAGWSPGERDQKLARLKSVIDQFKPISFHASVARDETWRGLKAVAPRGVGMPHFSCSLAIMFGIATHVARQSPTNKVMFIFDQQTGVDDDINLFFDKLINALSPNIREQMLGKPIYLDDKIFVPLQAADMLAWHLRRSHEEDGDWATSSFANEFHTFTELDSVVPSWTAIFSRMPMISTMRGKSGWQHLKKLFKAQFSRSSD